jgi:MFS family permease
VTQYGILTSVRAVVNPRFNLTTPLVSGLIYIAPGMGFFVGSVVGGRLSDHTVKKYIMKRDGVRIPKDRLNSGLVGLFIGLPISMLLYGWSLQKEVGGLALPIVCAFWIGLSLMGTFNALNTYTAEVSPSEKAEVVASKYLVQYMFGATSTAVTLPLIDTVGVGWSFTICMHLILKTPFEIYLLTRNDSYGSSYIWWLFGADYCSTWTKILEVTDLFT